MKLLSGIRATGTQNFSTTADNGDLIDITLYFLPASQKWKMDISYNDFQLNGNRVYSSPNMLRQYSNIIPFGLACMVDEEGEPFLINDFSTERANLYLLTEEEAQEVEDAYTEDTFL